MVKFLLRAKPTRENKSKEKQSLYNHINSCKDCMDALQAVFDAPTEEELKNEKVPKEVLEKVKRIPKMYPKERG